MSENPKYIPLDGRNAATEMLQQLDQLFPGANLQERVAQNPSLLRAAAMTLEHMGGRMIAARQANEADEAEAHKGYDVWRQDQYVWQLAPHLRDPLKPGTRPFGVHEAESIAALWEAGIRADTEHQPLNITTLNFIRKLLHTSDYGPAVISKEECNSVQARAFLERLFVDYVGRQTTSQRLDAPIEKTIEIIRLALAGYDAKAILASIGPDLSRPISIYKQQFIWTMNAGVPEAMRNRVLFLGCLGKEKRQELWSDSNGPFRSHILQHYLSKRTGTQK